MQESFLSFSLKPKQNAASQKASHHEVFCELGKKDVKTENFLAFPVLIVFLGVWIVY